MEFILLCGLPGCGKSTIAQKYYEQGYIVLSSDDIREEILNDVNDQNHNGDVFKILHERMLEALKSGKSVCYDATSLISKRRKNVLELIKKFDINKRIIVIATTYDQCIKNNMNRERQVPESVIKRMIKSFEFPFLFEGWNSIEIEYPFEINSHDISSKVFEELYDVEQDNPHHTLSILRHMTKCSQLVKEQTDNELLYYAAILHDIGKRYTKTYKNKKGEDTEYAHYYSHENVSTYNSLFYLKDSLFTFKEKMEILFYIQNHMRAHNISQMKSSTIEKYKNLWSEDRFNNLLLLAKADGMAK